MTWSEYESTSLDGRVASWLTSTMCVPLIMPLFVLPFYVLTFCAPSVSLRAFRLDHGDIGRGGAWRFSLSNDLGFKMRGIMRRCTI